MKFMQHTVFESKKYICSFEMGPTPKLAIETFIAYTILVTNQNTRTVTATINDPIYNYKNGEQGVILAHHNN